MESQNQTEETRNTIIRRLLSAKGAFVSGEDLSKELRVSRTALWKHIRMLEDVGFQFEASRRVGYKLTHAPDELMEPLVHMELPDQISLGQTILWQSTCESTNEYALELAKSRLHHGLVVTTAEQKGGKGRYGRVWTSPRGGMWFSVTIENPCAVPQAADLTLLASIAVHRVLQRNDVPCRIKWPNDILCNGKKLCGILAQMRTNGERVEYAVVGIGMNINFELNALPEDVRSVATTVLHETGQALYRPKVLAEILTELHHLYSDLSKGRGFSTVREEWKAASATLGTHVSILRGNERVDGIAVDIDHHGSLLLQLDTGGTEVVHSGEILFSSSERV